MIDAALLSVIRQHCAQPNSFWLDSALVDGQLGRRSIFGSSPQIVLSAWERRVQIQRGAGKIETLNANPLEALRQLLAEHRGRSGLAAGYLAYDLKRHIEDLPAGAGDGTGIPECYVAFYDDVHCVDPALLAPPPPPRPPEPRISGLRSSFSREAYEAAVKRILEHIRCGDIYQANLTQKFSAPCAGDPFDVYLALRALSPAPFAAFLRTPWSSVLSSSPELFLRYDPTSRLIETRPIKGTRPRGSTPGLDAELARELLTSEKDRAENLMIVDLERNDLGRVAEIGSVAVTSLFELETYATVHHLSSTVQARLRPDRDLIDLLYATFPGGSITGAPKIRAMEIIDEIEPVSRGIGMGAIGYFGFDGSLELNIAIRTMVLKDGEAFFSVGGGIVADSDPALEFEETLHKGAVLAHILSGGT
jgi:para-aminobenzoate synthetase component 1